jgi:hypothetical protein
LEVARVSSDQHELVLQGSRGNESIGRANAACSAEASSALCHGSINWDFIEWLE